MFQNTDCISQVAHEEIIVALAPLLENNQPTQEICEFFSKVKLLHVYIQTSWTVTYCNKMLWKCCSNIFFNVLKCFGAVSASRHLTLLQHFIKHYYDISPMLLERFKNTIVFAG